LVNESGNGGTGAATGAAIGAIGGPIGMGIGAILGGLFGANIKEKVYRIERSCLKRKAKTLEEITEEVRKEEVLKLRD
jgi:hypothetical protein